MHRGFLQNAGYGGTNGEPEHLTNLRIALEKEEEQLRHLRQQRLQLESSKAQPPSAPELPCDAPDEMAMKALAQHEEPPPAILHRLGVAVMLLLEAPFLVDLGDHPLPSRVPWRNLQVLLRKEKVTIPNKEQHSQMKEILAALQKGPFNQRLARHLSQRILGGDPPVTRSEVLELDPKCVVLFDWVTNLIAPLLGSQAPEILEVPELPEQRENASVAVGEQEKKVAQLRRKLRETIRSQEAAAEFAAQNRPGNVEMDTQCDPVRNGQSNGQGRQGRQGPGMAEDEVPGRKLSKRELLELEVTGQKSLQYRLEEVTIPATQEAILQSLVKILMEPRGMHRHLEVVGHCEDRESDDVAQRRAEAATQWLLEAGIPAERITVSWEVGGPALCRRTDFRLLDKAGSELEMRQKAEELMKRLFAGQLSQLSHPENQPENGHYQPSNISNINLEEVSDHTGLSKSGEADVKVPAGPAEVHADEVEKQEDGPCVPSGTSRSPTVSLEVSGEQVRLVFKKEGLSPQDALLDVGSKVVRLASLSGSWPQKEVTLPFDVQPEEPAAKFSRRAGTLTLTLAAAK
eukprot:s455_g10.t1